MSPNNVGFDESPVIGVIVPSSDGLEEQKSRRPLWLAVSAVAIAVVAFHSLGPAPSSKPVDTGINLAIPGMSVRTPRSEWIEARLEGSGGFTAVTDDGPRIVGVGTGRRIDALPLVYTSTDGVDWVAALIPAVSGDTLTSVAWDGERYVAAGFRPNLESGTPPDAAPIVWVSEGGGAWREVTTTGLPNRAIISAMTVSGTTLVAIGWEGAGTFEPLAAPPAQSKSKVWMSADGERWIDATPDEESAVFSGVTTFKGDVLVSGAVDGSPALWTQAGSGWSTSVLTDVAPDHWAVSATGTADKQIALVRAINDIEGIVTVWEVHERDSWTQLANRGSPDSAGWIRMLAGRIYAGAGFTRTIFPDGPELWTSELGTLWTGVEITRGASPWPPTIIAAVARLEDRLIAFGSRGGEPAVWSLIDS